MFFKDDELKYLKDCRAGLYDDDPMLTEFRAFFMSEFCIQLYGFICTEASGTLAVNRLQYVVDSEYQMMFAYSRNTEMEFKIKRKFSSLCVKYGKFDAFKIPEKYFAIYAEFDTELKREIMNQCNNEIEDYLKTIKEVKLTDFAFGAVFVFYELDENIAQYEASGLSKEISEHIFYLVKAKDCYDVYKKLMVKFDSVQTFNEKYQGNFYYYHK